MAEKEGVETAVAEKVGVVMVEEGLVAEKAEVARVEVATAGAMAVAEMGEDWAAKFA